jgi:hypothetical protein
MIFASRRSIGVPRAASARPRAMRRTGLGLVALLAATIAALISTTGALASSPVTVGYKDFTYGGGAARPTSDKPQSKLWFTDNTWYAGMFYLRTTTPTKSEYRIFRLDEATHSWIVTPTVIDTRDKSHADFLWDEAAQRLYVVTTHPTKDTANPDDHIKVYRFSYNAATNAYTALGGSSIAGTESTPTFVGGSWSATIAKASNGDIWVVWISSNTAPGATPGPGRVMYAVSADDGLHWTTPAQVPVEVGNSVRDGTLTQSDVSAVVTYGSRIGVMWSDHDNLPASTDNGYWFASIAAGDDPTVGGSWTLDPKVTNLVADGEQADNHLNVKVASDGTIYAVGKTNKDTINCATNTSLPLIELFKRTTGGTWTAHLVSTVGDCQTRPQVLIDEQIDTAYVLLSGPNGGGAVYLKSAPLSGPDALKFRGPAADGVIQLGVPFIKSATETKIDDVTTTKQLVTTASGIVANANNNLSTAKWYLHNEMPLPASDATAPTGTVSIAAGAAFTTTATVSVAVPATDAGSGMSLVRLANAAAVDGNGVLNDASAKSLTYTTPVNWTLAGGGDGTKTVYVQWRDAAGNWSAPVNDTIVLDATAPTGTVSINGGAAVTTTATVTLNLTTDDGTGSGTTAVLVSNSTDFAASTPIAYAASIPWTLAPNTAPAPSTETHTVYVKFIDAVGNVSASPVSDTIDFNQTDGVRPGATGAPILRFPTLATAGVPIRVSWTAATDNIGVAKYQVYRKQGTGAYVLLGQPTATSLDIALPVGSGWRIFVRAVDTSGNTGPLTGTATFTAIRYAENSSGVTYTGSWHNSTSASYIGGAARYSTSIGASVTLHYTGKSVAWVATKGPSSGSAKVYINGVFVTTVNLNSASAAYRQIVFQKTYSTSAARTLRIVLSGPSTHPRVTVDSFYVIR